MARVESKGLLEFRYADGAVATVDYETYAPRSLTKGDPIQYDGEAWLMVDRVDRGGVTVHLCVPAEGDVTASASRARSRRRGSG